MIHFLFGQKAYLPGANCSLLESVTICKLPIRRVLPHMNLLPLTRVPTTAPSQWNEMTIAKCVWHFRPTIEQHVIRMDHWFVYTESSGVPNGGIGDDVFFDVFFLTKKIRKALDNKEYVGYRFNQPPSAGGFLTWWLCPSHRSEEFRGSPGAKENIQIASPENKKSKYSCIYIYIWWYDDIYIYIYTHLAGSSC